MKELNKTREKSSDKIDKYNSNNSTNNSKLGNSNIILNQNGIPCYNNINIYTSNINGKQDINLRQYILNKKNNKLKSTSHTRSISNLSKI
jgi:hypothetical protein